MNASIERLPCGAITSSILIAGIVAGALVGHFIPATGQWLGSYVDYTLLTLVCVLFFGVRLGALLQAVKSLRFLTIAIFANFLVVPLIGYAIASLFLSAYPLFLIGLVIYFMSPCTDWFLSFTRLSGGNVALGTTLLPINMTLQLLLYPLFLQWFTQNNVQVDAGIIGNALVQWFLFPLFVAFTAHQALRLLVKPSRFEYLLNAADGTTPWITALLVLQIFAGNIAVILEQLSVFAWVLLAVFTFFVITFVLGESLSRLFQLRYPEHALLTMTIAARNAPLMLAITMAVLPNQPLIYAALIIGMLVELPHLTALRRLLLAERSRQQPEATSLSKAVGVS